MQMSRKRSEIEAWYQLPTNRKWRMADQTRRLDDGVTDGAVCRLSAADSKWMCRDWAEIVEL